MGWIQKWHGHQKEKQAADWLKQNNVKILNRNFTCKGGEIDIIGLIDDHLVFFEVKARKSTEYGHPLESISSSKQKRILKCAEFYLKKHPEYYQSAIRFDAITFIGEQNPEWHQNIIGV